MKSITIHNLEEPLDSLIRQRARKHGISLNKTIKLLLEEALGLRRKPPEDRRSEYLDMFGLWSAEDAREFNTSTEGFDKVDPKDWE